MFQCLLCGLHRQYVSYAMTSSAVDGNQICMQPFSCVDNMAAITDFSVFLLRRHEVNVKPRPPRRESTSLM
jgi:hypothetical protein